jgi:hypothetical protein
MSKPSFAQTAHAPFAQDNGDPKSVVATIVCPYCKHINTIHYQLDTDEIIASAKCSHLNHFETVTGHNCIYEFFKNEETDPPKVLKVPIVAVIVDHVKREMLRKSKFTERVDAVAWIKDELSGWMNPDDKIVKETRQNGQKEWDEYMIQCPDGSCLDYYAELHNG